MTRLRIDNSSSAKYKIGLSGSIFNVILFAITNTLKNSKWLRVVIGILGLISLLIGLLLFLTPEGFLGRFDYPFLVSGSTLTLGFILSSSIFELTLENDLSVNAEKERVEAEVKYEQDTTNPFSFLEVDTKRLNEYYIINQNQARNSFRWAVFAMFTGLLTITFGIWFFYLGKNTPQEKNTLLASLTTIAGVIVNIVSGLYIYLHNKSQKRSLLYYNQLIRNQQLGLSIRLAESLETKEEKSLSKSKIINQLLEIIKLQTALDNRKIAKETDGEEIKMGGNKSIATN